ncbi:glycosyltransferase [Amaricoccus tamworthensis]|uniref:glycosyltransferase n=1 Tax=Amaricoccus tamworthensis TaxID=57002 RepID=UPI003C7C7998
MRKAYVTLVTNDGFATGARALVNSLRLTGTDADIVVMHTDGVSTAVLPDVVHERVALPETSDAFNARHAKREVHANAPFTKGRKPEFHTPLDNFAKLRLWQLPYDRVVFLDADTLVLRNIDKLFDYPEFCAAPNVYESLADFHRLNSGVFTARPSQATFDAMIARLDAPDAYWRRTDQTFLQDFFPNWHGLPIYYNMLQYVWFNLPQLWDWASVKVVHYQYEKPWERCHPRAEQLGPLIDLWYAHAERVAPDPNSLANRCVR